MLRVTGPYLTLADPVVVLKPDVSVVLDQRTLLITTMGWSLPGQQRPVELPVGVHLDGDVPHMGPGAERWPRTNPGPPSGSLLGFSQ